MAKEPIAFTCMLDRLYIKVSSIGRYLCPKDVSCLWLTDLFRLTLMSGNNNMLLSFPRMPPARQQFYNIYSYLLMTLYVMEDVLCPLRAWGITQIPYIWPVIRILQFQFIVSLATALDKGRPIPNDYPTIKSS